MKRVDTAATLKRLSNVDAGYILTEEDKNDLRLVAKDVSDLHDAVDMIRKRLRKTIDHLDS